MMLSLEEIVALSKEINKYDDTNTELSKKMVRGLYELNQTHAPYLVQLNTELMSGTPSIPFQRMLVSFSSSLKCSGPVRQVRYLKSLVVYLMVRPMLASQYPDDSVLDNELYTMTWEVTHVLAALGDECLLNTQQVEAGLLIVRINKDRYEINVDSGEIDYVGENLLALAEMSPRIMDRRKYDRGPIHEIAEAIKDSDDSGLETRFTLSEIQALYEDQPFKSQEIHRGLCLINSHQPSLLLGAKGGISRKEGTAPPLHSGDVYELALWLGRAVEEPENVNPEKVLEIYTVVWSMTGRLRSTQSDFSTVHFFKNVLTTLEPCPEDAVTDKAIRGAVVLTNAAKKGWTGDVFEDLSYFSPHLEDIFDILPVLKERGEYDTAIIRAILDSPTTALREGEL